jgi:hypothetical protein
MVRADESFRRGPLQKCARFVVNRTPQEIVAGCVTNIQLQGVVEIGELHKVRGKKLSVLSGRLMRATGNCYEEQKKGKDTTREGHGEVF